MESAILEITEEIVEKMELHGVSKSELAKRLGKTPSFVTKILGGRNNFTLETMVKIGRRLNCNFRSHLQPEGMTTEWCDFYQNKPISAVSPPNVIASQIPVEYSPITHFESNEPISASA